MHQWLETIRVHHNLDIELDRFDMNGKALCLMNIDMFVKRVPVGGKLLYRDFRTRLYTAVYIENTMLRSLKHMQSVRTDTH